MQEIKRSCRKLITDEGLFNVADTIDRLVNVDIPARGSIGVLFEAARAQSGEGKKPLCLAAVELLQKAVRPGDYVFITTGWAEQPANIPDRSETDGPAGAAALARAIRLTLGGLPVILTDDYLVEGMRPVMTAAGFHVTAPERLPNSLSTELGFACCPTLAVLGLPIDVEQDRRLEAELLDRYRPACCISIERGGMNRHGRIHGMGGCDFSLSQAKMDFLFTGAAERGIATLGIGDGGNEIGMANIEAAVREKVRYGDRCKCPCQAGIVPDYAKVDVLVTATISNWGGYGVASLLALAEGKLDAMCSEELEARVLDSYLQAEFHDSISACVAPSADGCEAAVQLAVITLIRKSIFMGLSHFPAPDRE
ncbi:MAG: DUF4392 domain-containing protein [Fretibacterium sp.]|nr:DUF4392 domain-containing protein [Fretibacterium sp.]